MYGRRGPGLEPVWKSGPGDLDYNARSPDLAPKSHLSLKRWSAPELHVIKATHEPAHADPERFADFGGLRSFFGGPPRPLPAQRYFANVKCFCRPGPSPGRLYGAIRRPPTGDSRNLRQTKAKQISAIPRAEVATQWAGSDRTGRLLSTENRHGKVGNNAENK